VEQWSRIRAEALALALETGQPFGVPCHEKCHDLEGPEGQVLQAVAPLHVVVVVVVNRLCRGRYPALFWDEASRSEVCNNCLGTGWLSPARAQPVFARSVDNTIFTSGTMVGHCFGCDHLGAHFALASLKIHIDHTKRSERI
jgi:hypothetical protein